MKEQIAKLIREDKEGVCTLPVCQPDIDCSECLADQITALCEDECQARVERLIEDMEQYKTLDVIIISPEAWQAIKKEYLSGS